MARELTRLMPSAVADDESVETARLIVGSAGSPIAAAGHRSTRRWEPAADGLLRTVQPSARDSWVALSLDPGRVTPPPEHAVAFRLQVVQLDRRVRRLYQTACERVLSPAMRGAIPEDVAYHEALEAWGEGFLRAGSLLASALTQEWLREPAPVLLEDFRTCGAVPALRGCIPTARIVLAHHGPFAEPEVLAGLPLFVSDGLLRAMLGCDLLTFDSPHDLGRFAEACSRLLGARVRGDVVEWQDRIVALSVTGPGLRARPLAPQVMPARMGSRPDMTVIASAGRSDPSCRLVESVEGFRELLAVCPDLTGRVRLHLCVCLWLAEVPEHRSYLLEIQQAAARVNAELATDEWIPVALETSATWAAVRSAVQGADVVLLSGRSPLTGPLLDEALESPGAPVMAIASDLGLPLGLEDAVVGIESGHPAAIASRLRLAIGIPLAERLRRMQKIADAPGLSVREHAHRRSFTDVQVASCQDPRAMGSAPS